MSDEYARQQARGCMIVVAAAALVCATALAVGARWGVVTGLVTLLLLVAACAIAWAAAALGVHPYTIDSWAQRMRESEEWQLNR